MLEHALAEIWTRGRPAVMGIVNVTPDSFSDGGRLATADEAVAYAVRLAAEGADLIDVGGESTRPGASPVPADVERERVVPVVARLKVLRPDLPVSVDTSKASVAAAALDAGAVLVNDVSAGRDPAMFGTVAARRAGLVLMHMRGEPRTMQSDTQYDDVVAEVHAFLGARAAAASGAGVAPDRILLDPGIGFGKDVAGNLALLRALPDLAAMGYAVVLGASRKSFIGAITGAPTGSRLPGSLAAASFTVGIARCVVRVHDVAETVQYLEVLAAAGSAA